MKDKDEAKKKIEEEKQKALDELAKINEEKFKEKKAILLNKAKEVF